jgi:hypothetical protein
VATILAEAIALAIGSAQDFAAGGAASEAAWRAVLGSRYGQFGGPGQSSRAATGIGRGPELEHDPLPSPGQLIPQFDRPAGISQEIFELAEKAIVAADPVQGYDYNLRRPEYLGNRTLFTDPMIIGRPPVNATPATAFMGGSEFTPTIGSPGSQATAIRVSTPPNSQTPQDGFPGGSFDYNSILTSLFRWDYEPRAVVTNAAAAVAIDCPIKKGIWAYEFVLSSNTGAAYTEVIVQSLIGGVTNIFDDFYLSSGTRVVGQGLRQFSADGSFQLYLSAVAVANYVIAILRCKQLTSL